MITFLPLLEQVYPRILTQVCRDAGSPAYGSFDRNWWHYKIRDFSSAILQQGGYFVHVLKDLKNFEASRDNLENISRASVDFWVKRCLKKGAFEEYYPWEDGYPPLAFSSLSAAKIVDAQKINYPQLEKALQKAGKKLMFRFEKQAANQQIAGLAALSVIKKIRPHYVSDNAFEEIVVKTLALQSPEGWFMEYDGPDLGYLSVSMDCLWDLYDYTHDQRFLLANKKALSFMANLVSVCEGPIGMHNARNTDYIVPYGITRFLLENDLSDKETAHALLHTLYEKLNSNLHFFHAIDDRYWCHYIGHSVARAEIVLQNLPFALPTDPKKITATSPAVYMHSGHFTWHTEKYNCLVSCLKGGILTLTSQNNYFSNFGWIVTHGKSEFVTHWWDTANQFKSDGNKLKITIRLVPHKENTSTPFKHFILRVISYFLGYKIIGLLKNRLIFKKNKNSYTFEREITFEDHQISIHDIIRGLNGNEVIKKAPRSSKRHVASADSFHIEDFVLAKGFTPEENTLKEKNIFTSSIRVKLT